MRTVHISASRGYDVHIGPGLLDTLGNAAKKLLKGSKICLVSDDLVAKFYLNRAKNALETAGFSVYSYVFPHGEASKSGENFLKLMNFLAENRLTCADGLVALGGGVTGDLTGFAASCYLRGVKYIQVPTSLLAMVDSSVGGKTAIDLPAGKNLCGAFWQPALVLCDTDLLSTLPDQIFTDGCAEVIKYAVLGDPELFETLKTGIRDKLEAVVATCVDAKRAVVEEDEFDTGRRQLLNLGHTLGHAVEANSKFALAHGQSVAIGMAMIAKAAVSHGLCTEETGDEIIALLRQYGLPVETDQSAEAILATALGDKKRRSDTLTLIVPRAVGKCELHPIPVSELHNWLPG